jgi:acetolactate synthase I/III small subunit
MRHIISILVQNEAGVLSRVSNLFSSRGYNIESLNVAPTADKKVSRVTLVTRGSDEVIEQITKQLGKVIDVVAITDLTTFDHIERELALFKLQVEDSRRNELDALLEKLDIRVLDDHGGYYTVEVAGGGPDIDHFLERVTGVARVVSVVRSGAMAISRGARKLGRV